MVLNYLIKNVTAEDRLLIVDDVFDTGQTVDAVIKRRTGQIEYTPDSRCRAVLQTGRREVERVPEYFLEKPTHG